GAVGGGGRRHSREPLRDDHRRGARGGVRALADVPAAAVADRRRACLGGLPGMRRRMKPVAPPARPPYAQEVERQGGKLRVAKGVMVGVVVFAAFATIFVVGGGN